MIQGKLFNGDAVGRPDNMDSCLYWASRSLGNGPDRSSRYTSSPDTAFFIGRDPVKTLLPLIPSPRVDSFRLTWNRTEVSRGLWNFQVIISSLGSRKCIGFENSIQWFSVLHYFTSSNTKGKKHFLVNLIKRDRFLQIILKKIWRRYIVEFKKLKITCSIYNFEHLKFQSTHARHKRVFFNIPILITSPMILF